MDKEPRRGFTLKTVLVSLTLVGAGILTAWVTTFQDSSLSRVRGDAGIRIGYAVEAPYAFLTPQGKVTGESPEIAAYVASRLGIRKILWRNTEFGALIPELEAGRIDVIAAGMFVTPERASRVRFSEPTFRVHQGLLVPKGNPKQLSSYRQLVHTPGLKVAVLSGAAEEKALQGLGIPAQRLLRVPDARTGLVAVESGAADCLALSSPTLRWMTLNSRAGRTEIAHPLDAGSPIAEGFGAFAFRKEDKKLLAAWNQVLKSYVGSQQHRDLIARFGFSSGELPVPASPAEDPPR